MSDVYTSDQSRLVRRTTPNPIVSTIRGGHYLTLYKRGRAVRQDAYGRAVRPNAYALNAIERIADFYPAPSNANRLRISAEAVCLGIIVLEILLFSRFGGDLLSHVLRRSTIGVLDLNGRVRDGIGCLSSAMTTKPRKKQAAALAPAQSRT